MKISYIYGACVKHDAISNSIRDEIDYLRASGMEDVRLYAHECHHETVPFFRASSLTDIAFDPHFQESDLAVFHFGIYYALFDLLALVPRRAKRLVVFHNITPREFVSPLNRPSIDRSLAQMRNMEWADHVVCDSETNLSVLRARRIQVAASVIPLAVRTDTLPPTTKPSFVDGVLRIVFVGRFVPSKGPHDLLEALKRSVDAGVEVPLRLDLVGNLAYSEPELVKQLRQMARDIQKNSKGNVQICFHGDATDEVKQQLLREADLFVLPTYHEGFCVPIVEALASGCKVIAYENSNTPAISGGLATLTPTGDVGLLASAINTAAQHVRSAEWRNPEMSKYVEYSRLAHSHVQQFSPNRTGTQFVALVRELIDPASRRLVDIRLPGLPDFRLEVHAEHDQYISADIEQNRTWEPFETSVFCRLCREGDCVLDIGANIGWYSVIGSFHVGKSGRVIAFEPAPDNYDILERNLRRCAATNVQALRVALGSVCTDAKLYLSDCNRGDHHLFDDGSSRASLPIKTQTLDQLFANEVRLPEVVKSDTQGSEGLILNGAAQLLGGGWRPIWLLEFWPFGLCKFGTDPMDMIFKLSRLGYSFFELLEQRATFASVDPEMLSTRVTADLHPDTGHFTNLLAIPQGSDRLEELSNFFDLPRV